jgi:hypothetical protein
MITDIHKNNNNNNNNNNNRTDTIDMDDILKQFECEYYTPRQIAMLRIRLLSNVSVYDNDNNNNHYDGKDDASTDSNHFGGGLAERFLPLLNDDTCAFIRLVNDDNPVCPHHQNDNSAKNSHDEYQLDFDRLYNKLHRILLIYLRWVQIDATLSDELGRQGSHLLLIQVMELSIPEHDQNQWIGDRIEALQDLAGEISVASKPQFPFKASNPFTIIELQQRLPLTITIQSNFDALQYRLSLGKTSTTDTIEVHQLDQENNVPQNDVITVLIHQIASRQSAQIDVGFGECDSFFIETFCRIASNARLQFNSSSLLRRTHIYFVQSCGRQRLFCQV